MSKEAYNGTAKIRKLLGLQWVEYESILMQSLDSDNTLLNSINRHLLNNSGKMVRPLLVLLTANACAEDSVATVDFSKAVACAAVSELIHTATLLHDDVVDDSNLRRGVITVKSLFSPGASLLMGDYWLSKAINILVSHKCGYEILRNYSQTIEDLADGELLQMERAGDLLTTEEDYYCIIHKKTASLFIASVKSAAIAVSAPRKTVDSLHQYAYHLGISFQIRDDLYDYLSKEEEVGKDVNSDIGERKITIPLIGAFKNAPHKKEEIIAIINKIDILKKMNDPANAELIAEVKQFVRDNDGIEYAKRTLDYHIKMAVTYLSSLKDSLYKLALIKIAQSIKV